MLIIRFGDQMNNVAVTDGDKVSAEQVLGYHVDYYPINDVMTHYLSLIHISFCRTGTRTNLQQRVCFQIFRRKITITL